MRISIAARSRCRRAGSLIPRRPTSSSSMAAVPVSRAAAQIVLRVTAAIPGDEAYGHLAADCSEDLLNALVGIFTDMAAFGRVLGRPVIYTPLPICSVYAGVLGAIAVGAAIVDRERSGAGREIIASRLAGGLSAIGALTLTSTRHSAAPGAGQLSGGVPAGSRRSSSRTSSRRRLRFRAGNCGWRSAFAACLAVHGRRWPAGAADGGAEPAPDRTPPEGARRLGRGAGRRHGERIVLRPERVAVRRPQPGGLDCR